MRAGLWLSPNPNTSGQCRSNLPVRSGGIVSPVTEELPMSDAYDLDTELARAAAALKSATKVTVLTGAGVSAESGVPTFRASDGLWEGHRVEDVATPMAFEANPELVWRFYNGQRVNVAKVSPNPGHLALVELENRFGDGFAI